MKSRLNHAKLHFSGTRKRIVGIDSSFPALYTMFLIPSVPRALPFSYALDLFKIDTRKPAELVLCVGKNLESKELILA